MKILFLWLVSLLLDIIGLIAVPIGLLFCNRDSISMPKLFWLWGNDVETINGDIYWRTDPKHHPHDYWKFWPRFVWLAVRNRSNNFITFVLGFRSDATTLYFDEVGDSLTSDQPVGHSGKYQIKALHAGKTYPMTYIVRQYPFWKSRCFRYYVGWRNKGKRNNGTRVGFVFAINPFKGFREVE